MPRRLRQLPRTNISRIVCLRPIGRTNLVKSVREPGEYNGGTLSGPEMISRRLEILHQIAQRSNVSGSVYNRPGPNTATALEALRPAAASLGITLWKSPPPRWKNSEQFSQARAQSADPGLDAIITNAGTILILRRQFYVINKFAPSTKSL